MQGGAKVGLQLWVHETQSLFLYYYLLIIVLFPIWTTANLLLFQPVYPYNAILFGYNVGEPWKHYTNKISQSQKTTSCTDPFRQNVWNRQILRDKRVDEWLPEAWGRGEWAVIATGRFKFSFWGNRNVLEAPYVAVYNAHLWFLCRLHTGWLYPMACNHYTHT